MAENLKAVLQEYGLSNSQTQIFCDDGPENNGDVNALLDQVLVQKVIANFQNNSTNNN